MRLIDADFATREARVNPGIYDLNDVPEWLRCLPTVDAEPVVRCKDCKHAIMTHDGYTKYCDFFADTYEASDPLYLEPGFYCSYGKKRGQTDDL